MTKKIFKPRKNKPDAGAGEVEAVSLVDHNHAWKYKLAIFTSLTLVVAASFWGLSVLKEQASDGNKDANSNSYPCTNGDAEAQTLLTEAEPNLAPSKNQDLKSTVDKILAEPNYAQDANCLGIVVTYYINVSDAANARTYYDKLVSVYNKDKAYDTRIMGKVLSPEETLPIVEFLERQAANVEKNSTIQGPTEDGKIE